MELVLTIVGTIATIIGTYLAWAALRKERAPAKGERQDATGSSTLSSQHTAVRQTGSTFPVPLTSFLGRTREIAELKELLVDHRLVTLTGPGGIGKTRLSIEVARQLERRFAAEIFWLPLTTVTDPELLVHAMLEHFGVKENAAEDTLAALVDFFSGRPVLLVLDNFEQIAPAAPVIEQILQSCPQLHVIVSSRVVLQVPGEYEYPVPTLRVPRPDKNYPYDFLLDTPSIALFTERAQDNRRNFTLTAENAARVATICFRLEGLPLAIELAAARMKLFSLDQLAERLEQRLDMLTGDGRFAGKHQTLRRTIDWSYELLTPTEQQFFRRLAIFPGGFTLDAATSVLHAFAPDRAAIEQHVLALVDKSLLYVEESAGQLRFKMLETIREYAIDTLATSGEGPAAKRSHVAYFVELAEVAAPHLTGARVEEFSARLAPERANFRAAIDYAIESAHTEQAYRLGLSLRPFWGSRGLTVEGIQQLEKLTTLPAEAALLTQRLKVLQALGMLYMYVPHIAKAIDIFEETLTHRRTLDQPREIGRALNDLTWAYLNHGNFRQAEDLAKEALSLLETQEASPLLISTINNFGWLHLFRSRPRDAAPYFERNLKLTEAAGENRRHAYALMNLSWTHIERGNYDRAEQQLQAALDTHRRNSDLVLEGYGLFIQGFGQYARGAFADCWQSAELAEEIGRETNARFTIGNSYFLRGLAKLGQNDLSAAELWSKRAFEFHRDNVKCKHWITRSLAIRAKAAFRACDLPLVCELGDLLLTDEIAQASYQGLVPALELAALLCAETDRDRDAKRLFDAAQRARTAVDLVPPRSEHSWRQAFINRLPTDNGSPDPGWTLAQAASEAESLFARFHANNSLIQ